MLKLCYVEAPWAYFTTQELDKQWGDDWNDAPYEHNAGRPYQPARPDLPDRAVRWPKDWNEDGTPKWYIVKLAFEVDSAKLPFEDYYNSPFSVEDINQGMAPWIIVGDLKIMAGASMGEFIEVVKKKGGRVYLEIT